MNRGGVKFSLYKSIINIPGKSHNSFKKKSQNGKSFNLQNIFTNN